MITFQFPFERKGKKRVALTVDNYFKHGFLKLDGVEIWRFESEAQFRQGETLVLGDGSKLEIQLRPSPSTGKPVIYIARDGYPLPGSAFNQQSQYDQSLICLRILGGVFAVGGLLSLIGEGGFLLTWFGASVATLIAGLLVLALTFVPDDKKVVAFVLSAVIGAGEAYFYVTQMPIYKLPAILRLLMIVCSLACLQSFRSAQAQNAEIAARKASTG